MDEKEKLLSDAKKTIIEDERLKLLLKGGRISEETYDLKHGEINIRLADIKEQIARIERRKKELSKPASVVKFNTSYLKRRAAERRDDAGAEEPLNNVGMVAVLSCAAIIIGLLAFPKGVYSSLPDLPEPYAMPPSSEFYIYIAALCSQIVIGGLFLWIMSRITKVKGTDMYRTRTCTAQGALVSSAALSIAWYISSSAGYVPALRPLAYGAGFASYFYAIKSALDTNNLTAGFLSLSTYAANYALALGAMVSIIILL